MSTLAWRAVQGARPNHSRTCLAYDTEIPCFSFEPGQVLVRRGKDLRDGRERFLGKVAVYVGDRTRIARLRDIPAFGISGAPHVVTYLGTRPDKVDDERLLVDGLFCWHLAQNWVPLEEAPPKTGPRLAEDVALDVRELVREGGDTWCSYKPGSPAYEAFTRLDRRPSPQQRRAA